jgi:dienelactone hydrolase
VPERYQKLPIGKLAVPSSLAEWNKQRPAVGKIVVDSLGGLPPRPSRLDVKTLWTKERAGYKLEKFVFDNGVDSIVPGYLAIPTGRSGPFPAVLAMHGHGSSKENIFGFEPSSQTVVDILTKRGYVVMAIDNYFAGERRGAGPAGTLEMQMSGSDQEMSLFKLNLWLGRTLWGMMVRDEQIALDYLASRPEVDKERIGAQGMSMGSTRSWWLAAVDDRVKALVGIACFTRYEDLIAVRALRAHGIYYFVPGILKHFDSEGVMALVAPRPFLALTGDRDLGSPPEGIRNLERILDRFYELYGKPAHFQSILYPDTGHVYTDAMKQRMLDWFDAHL